MLTTLLESRSHRARDKRGAVASVLVHAAIIFGAVYATAAGAPPRDRPVNPPAIHWIETPPNSTPSTPLPTRPSGSSSPVPVAHPLTAPIEIPNSIPSIDLQTRPVTISDFSRSMTGNSNAPDKPAPGGGRRAYDISEVETPVTVIGNNVPEYPSALRASGIEGRVVAEFVVTELGRPDAASLRIISATSDAFVESIRRALPRMRFKPAKIGERSVPQLVQQQFVFRLDR